RAFDAPPGGFEPGRVPLAPAPPDAVRHASSARPQDLDPMGHVNNAVYLDYLEDAVGSPPALPWRFRLEYRAAAGPASELVARWWPVGRDTAFELTTGGDSPVTGATDISAAVCLRALVGPTEVPDSSPAGRCRATPAASRRTDPHPS
ncbi:MAG TPA: thioesterase family protein, partial [Candidatus Limnocylindrales bacterium]